MRDLITTVFELGGCLLINAAAGIQVAVSACVPAGLAVAGVMLLAESALIVVRSKPRGKSA